MVENSLSHSVSGQQALFLDDTDDLPFECSLFIFFFESDINLKIKSKSSPFISNFSFHSTKNRFTIVHRRERIVLLCKLETTYLVIRPLYLPDLSHVKSYSVDLSQISELR